MASSTIGQPQGTLHLGIVGAGLGGLLGAIAIARAGAKVTVLEAAEALGEIGAGIQMTPNVSRLLIRYGVADLIGNNLVQCDEINTWNADGSLLAWTDLKRVIRNYGFPWWVVRRDHLHSGLAESCRRHGVNLVIDARVAKIDYSSSKQVTATTTKGATYTFDLLIGSDGIKSVVRSTLFPDFRPYAPTTNACYRAVIPYTEVFAKVPEARTFLRNSIDVWGCDNGYVIGYPISGGQEFNLVLSHHRDNYVEDVEEVDMDEFRAFGKGFHPIVQKIINICPYSKRWPLMVTELKSWSSPQKNVVLMGDAAHSMVNHMAQGAATAMEDGAFLGTVIGEVLRGTITMPEAVELYEKTRMPRVWAKQQGSFMMGSLIMYAGDRAEARNKSSRVEVRSVENNPTNPEPRPSTYRSWVLWANPESVPHMATYDAEGDADMAVCRYLQERSEVHPKTRVAKKIEEKWWGYVRPGIFEPQDEKSGAVEDDQGMWKFARKSNL